MSYTNNDESIALVDGNLNPLAVSQSQVITPVSQSGFLASGYDNTDNSVKILRITSVGNVKTELFSSTGTALAVSNSQVTSSNTPAIIMAGVTSTGQVKFADMAVGGGLSIAAKSATSHAKY